MRVLSDMKIFGVLTLGQNSTDFPLEPELGMLAIVDGVLYAYLDILEIETWYPLTQRTRSHIHTQGVAALQWVVEHNMDSENIWYQIQDSSGNIMIAEIIDKTANSFTVNLLEAMTGAVVVVAPDTVDVPVVKTNLLNADNIAATILTKGGVDVPNETEVQALIDAAQIYDIAFSVDGKPDINSVIARLVVNRAFDFPTNLTGSVGRTGVNATTNTVFSIRKNGTQFGTATFTSAGALAGFAATATSFVAGDLLTVVAPGTQDATLADFGITLSGIIA